MIIIDTIKFNNLTKKLIPQIQNNFFPNKRKEFVQNYVTN